MYICRCAVYCQSASPGDASAEFVRLLVVSQPHCDAVLLLTTVSFQSIHSVSPLAQKVYHSDEKAKKFGKKEKKSRRRGGEEEGIKERRMITVWIIGGPGCGKGTQCERIIAKYGFLHLSSGDLLREEVASGSPRGAELQELMSKGLFVPTDVVLDLIKERMNKAREAGTTTAGFLIDGYPRELDQGILFEKNVCPVDVIIFFDVANETLKKRLLGRAAVSQRADDNEETIMKRIEIFNQKNGPIIEHYKDKVVKINAEGAVDDIFAEVSKALDRVLAA